MSSALLVIACIVFLLPVSLSAQTKATADSSSINLSPKQAEKFTSNIGNKSSDVKLELEKSTDKYLDKLKTQEQTLQKQLSKVDPAAADRIFNESARKYESLQNDLRNNSQNVLKACGKYVPGIDSAITSLKFLQQNSALSDKLGTSGTQIKAALSKVQALEDQFKKTDNVEDFVKQREEYLKQQLSSFNLPGLQQYNQEAAYYAQQVSDLRQDWEDPSRMEKKAFSVLNKMPAFQEFMQKNSMIASLFNLPDDYGNSGVAGLQTKDEVQKVMQEAMKTLGPNGGQTALQNIGDAQTSMTTLRNKLNQGNSDLTMPDGKGNNQHTKRLLRRLEYGCDVQSTRSNSFFPSITTIALSAAYKLSDRNSIGLAIGYSIGWGRDIQHISITGQGIQLRSFTDIKIKGSFYGSGEFEYNYAYPFSSISQLKSSGLWQKSALVGLTKMVSLRGTLVKKTKLQLLFNFLSFYQIPKTQPIIFRVGYNF